MKGEAIAKRKLTEGRPYFFAHSGRGRISHVGIVEEVTSSGEIKFIHASTSRGVMVSSLDDSYWRGKYRSAKNYCRELVFCRINENNKKQKPLDF